MRKAYQPAFAIAREIEQIAAENGHEPIEVYAPKIIEALKGDHVAFMELDDRWHTYSDKLIGILRRVRNSLEWGPKMFASFKE